MNIYLLNKYLLLINNAKNMSNILNNNFNNLKIKLNNRNYWDFCLNKSFIYNKFCLNNTDKIDDECLIADIDLLDNDCIQDNCLISKPNAFYRNYTLIPYSLKNYGYCGIDNGHVFAPRDRISNQQFINIIQNTHYDIDSKLLKLCKVSSNTKIYEYPLSFENDCIKCNGGFLQGFFETECEKFRIFPTTLNNTITFSIELKPFEFEKESNKTLNDKHPNNKGFFLYLGTRAENKWALIYNNLLYNCKEMLQDSDYLYDKAYETPQKEQIKNVQYFQVKVDDPYVIDGYLTDRDCDKMNLKLSFIRDGYFDLESYDCCDRDEPFCSFTTSMRENGVKHGSCNNCRDGEGTCGDYIYQPPLTCEHNSMYPYDNNCCRIPLYAWRSDNILLPQKKYKTNNSFISGDWLAKDAFSDIETIGDNYLLESQYSQNDLDISDFDFRTEDGVEILKSIKIIKSNNKFLLFDRTSDGFIVPEWDEENYGVYYQYNRKYKGNLFLLMNSSEDGYNIDNIDEITENVTYNINNDLIRNALGFRITDNGEIGYRYLVQDCEINELTAIEGYSKKNIVKYNEWSTITIKIKPFNDKMKIYFYVNGNLVFITRTLPKLKLRQLNDLYEKQEGVPFNISLGGGSQGLCDVLMTNYMVTVDEIYPIEQYFGGSFIGYIKHFQIYNCDIEHFLLKKTLKK